jgi:hypothetical protein
MENKSGTKINEFLITSRCPQKKILIKKASSRI